MKDTSASESEGENSGREWDDPILLGLIEERRQLLRFTSGEDRERKHELFLLIGSRMWTIIQERKNTTEESSTSVTELHG